MPFCGLANGLRARFCGEAETPVTGSESDGASVAEAQAPDVGRLGEPEVEWAAARARSLEGELAWMNEVDEEGLSRLLERRFEGEASVAGAGPSVEDEAGSGRGREREVLGLVGVLKMWDDSAAAVVEGAGGGGLDEVDERLDEGWSATLGGPARSLLYSLYLTAANRESR